MTHIALKSCFLRLVDKGKQDVPALLLSSKRNYFLEAKIGLPIQFLRRHHFVEDMVCARWSFVFQKLPILYVLLTSSRFNVSLYK